MRFVTPLALAIALAVTSGAVSAPAFAAKDKKADAAPAGGPDVKKLSTGFRTAIVKAQEAEKKKDVEGQKAAIAEATPLATNPDEKYFLNSTKLNLSIATNDAALQGEAISGMLDTGLVTDPKQIGQFNAIAAESALQGKNYDVAIQRAQTALQAGYKPEAVNVTLAQAYFGKAGTGNASVEPARGLNVQGLAALKTAADATKAAGQAVPAQWYAIGVSRAEQAKVPEVTEWAKMAYEADPKGENLRTLVRLFQRANPNLSTRENLDVLRLMSASGGLVIAVDYMEYAEMAARALSYGEVKSTIEAGRAKGVLSDSQGAEYYQTAMAKIPSDKGSLSAAEADSRKSASGKAAAGTADALMGYGDYAKAAELFQIALQKGGVDANEVNTRIGIAKTLSGDVAGAKAAFGAVAAGPRKSIADLWMSYLNTKTA